MTTFKTMYLIDEELKKKIDENISQKVLPHHDIENKINENPTTQIQEDNKTDYSYRKRIKDDYVPNVNPAEQYSLVKPVQLTSGRVKSEDGNKRIKKQKSDFTNYFKNTNSPIIQTLKPSNDENVYKSY